MAYTQSLMSGVPTVIAQTTAYALPPRGCFIQSTVALEVSVDGTTYVTLAASTTGAQTGATFVRCTTAPTTVIVKKF